MAFTDIEPMLRSFSPAQVRQHDLAARHHALRDFNARRLKPGLPDPAWLRQIEDDAEMLVTEGLWLEEERKRQSPRAAGAPADPDGFVAWFEDLRETGPGQNDALFRHLAQKATQDQMRWFIAQEVSGEAGFEDLVALTQLRLPVRAKLEMARNYWDEMGRGDERGMHGPMLEVLADGLGVAPYADDSVWEPLALNNLVVGLAINRRFAYHAIGAMGAIELTAPARAKQVSAGLRRLAVNGRTRHYFDLHAMLDIRHAEAWNREVIRELVAGNPAVARAIAEGALMRLDCGERCFIRYRAQFGI